MLGLLRTLAGSGPSGDRGGRLHPPSPPSTSRSGSRIRVKRRYDLGVPGLLYVGVTLFIALGAFNSQNNLLFWAFGFALAVLLVSGIVSGSMLMGVSVERVSTTQARVGEAAAIRYRVHNRNRVFPVFALSIEESGVGPAPRRGWLARMLWPRRVAASPNTGPARAFVGQVGAGQTVFVEARVETVRRGPARLKAVVAHSAFPFGLMRKVLWFMQPGTVLVLPKVVRPAEGELGLADSLDAVRSASSGRGAGDEFHALREYRPGDPLRDIAWRASARRGGLLVRQTTAAAPQRVWIVPELRARRGSAEADEATISLAAGVAELAEASGAEYGVLVPLTGASTPVRRGAGHLSRVMSDLAMLELGADDGRGAGLGVPAQAGGRGTVCVLVGREGARVLDAAARGGGS